MEEEKKEESEEEKKKITSRSIKHGLGVLVRYLKKYLRETFFISILGIVSALGNGGIPFITGRFFDAIITPGMTSILGYTLPLFAALLVIWSIVQLVTYFVDWKINIESENFSNRVWGDYWFAGVAHLLMLPMSYHKGRKIGEIGEKINRASWSLETIVGRIVIDLAPQFLSIVIAVAIGFYIQPLLATALLVAIGFYIFVLYRSVGPIAGIQREYQFHLFRAYGDSYDLVGNVKAIKQATAENAEKERMGGLMREKILPLWGKMNLIWSNLTLFQRVIILGTQVLIFVVSVIFIGRGEMTVGDLLAFNAYAAMVFVPFVTLGRNWQVIQNGIIQLDEAERIFETVPENYYPSGAPSPKTLRGNVEFENTSFHYEENSPVLKGVSFGVKAGEVVALVGESGVGKSTIVDLICGFHFPTEGVVRIDGESIEKLDLLSLRSQIGVVPQEVVLFNDTILHNIRYGSFESTEEEAKEAARRAHAYDFIEKFPDKWQQAVGERGVKLSVGQKQRVAIARAILRNPKILILDEPTSALDAGSEKLITESLEELMKGKTTFIVAHRLSTVRKADKILVFKEGTITETGTHDELVQKHDGEYRRLYELQIGLHG